MLFLSGPRQVGKTTLVTQNLCTQKEAYFNWDDRKVRLAYHKNSDFFVGAHSEWICFDEIHKRPQWKDILKGLYDVHKDRYRFVITGSARLETFRKSGDSLVGRYFHTRLFPLNLPDFKENNFALPKNPEEIILRAAEEPDGEAFKTLLDLGGFPEPFFSGREEFWKRWSNNHVDLIIQEDLRDLSKVLEIDKIEKLLDLLQPGIGNPVSYRNLANDLETTHASIKRWLEMLNRVQLVFPVSPYFKKLKRGYKKEKKWYPTDWRAAQTNRFENYIASSLFRAVTLYTDRFGDKMSLHFVRTHDGTEVDFLICREEKPWLLIESKEGTPDISSACYRFSHLFQVPCVIVTQKKNFFKKVIGPEKQTIYCLSWSKLGPLLP
ncbi:MAG: ATP-binding protein [Deltaproteobacteria bacterium]|nr:ATP-binding protein [Deltaproteobacteria bacterium]